MTNPWTPHSAVAQAVSLAGFSYDPGQDIMYSRHDALQRRLGYAYGYDATALGISADIDCEPIFFDYGGKHWMIELWKGQYGLMSGCEIGVYTRPIGSTGPAYTLLDNTVGQRPGDSAPSHNLFYDCAADADMLTLKSTLHRDGQVLFTRGPETHWWLTGFKWGVLSERSQLSVDVEITLKDSAMLQAFQAAIAGRPYPNLKVTGTTVSFTFAQPFAVPQPAQPASILADVKQANQQVVSAYNQLHLPSNDPNGVQAGFLIVEGLGLLHLADLFGLAVCQLAAGIGQSMSSVVTALVGKLADAAATVQGWLSAVSLAFATWVDDIEKLLGIPLDFSCYVEVDNTGGRSDLVLSAGTAIATYGWYVVAPPSWIPRGTVARFILKDPKPSPHGTEGSATYQYCDANLTVKTATFSYECPTGFLENSVTSSQADWACFGKSGDAGAAWSQPAPTSGHPLFIRYAARVAAATQPWNNAPPLRIVAASQQGGPRGAQLWGVDTSGTLRSAYQETPGGSWSGWSGVWNGASPGQLISVTAAQQNNGTVQIWVLDTNNLLYSNAQTSPGGNWTGWSPAGWNEAPALVMVAASQQGGSRGAQLWGVDTSGTLRSAYQETPGGSWSGWSGVWNGASPGQLISVTAAQQNNGTVQIWVLDTNNLLYSNAQTSPGGNWTGWSPSSWPA